MYAIIMAGGSGTRFWPLSRAKMPKQLLKIGGEDTLICQTVDRIMPLVDPEKIFIVTNRSLAESIGFQLSSKFCRSWDGNFILEPESRNTAPALGIAALHLERLDPESIMVVLSADHAIRDTREFLNLLRRAEQLATKNYLVTLGIRPRRPETGYGYIQAGELIQGHGSPAEAFRVEAFVEKPGRGTAEEYVASKRYYWNSGIFIWKTKVLLAEIERYQPGLSRSLQEIRKNIGTDREGDAIKEAFQRMDSLSIDYAVMEHTKQAAVLPADIGWSDVGSWAALDDVVEKDSSGNIRVGNVVDLGCAGSIIYAEKRLVATIGLTDTIVVDTPDAVLVCAKERAQDVKKVVTELKKRNAEEHLIHRTVHRPWGSYTVLESGDRYKIKRIVLKPGAKLSHQLHHHRSEHWVVVSGTAQVTNGENIYTVHPNESTYIPLSTKHRLENLGKVPLQIIEVQNGEYLEEDDIIRFDDDYRRHECAEPHWLPPLTKLPNFDQEPIQSR